MNKLEEALAALANATDGAGRAVALIVVPPTPENLRKATVQFGRINEGFVPVGTGRNMLAQLENEIAFWRNLALLANATAESIAYDMQRNGV